MANLKVKGLNEVIAELKKFGKEGEKVIDGTLDAVAEEMVGKAKSELTAFDTGKLFQSIRKEKIAEMSYQVEAGQGAPYAPYIEYGTGGFVEVPKEFVDDAIKAKGKGIRQVNIMPRPFMFPAFLYGQKIIVKELEKSLEQLTSKMK